MMWNSSTVQLMLTPHPTGSRHPEHHSHSCQSHKSCRQQQCPRLGYLQPPALPRAGFPGVTFHFGAQVVAHFAEDEVDVLLGGDGV